MFREIKTKRYKIKTKFRESEIKLYERKLKIYKKEKGERKGRERYCGTIIAQQYYCVINSIDYVWRNGTSKTRSKQKQQEDK